MKLVLTFFSFLTIALAEPAPKLVDAPKPIQNLVSNYVAAFDHGDLAALKKVTTLKFIETAGGPRRLGESLKAIKGKTQSVAKNVSWITLNGNTYAHFTLRTDADEGEVWLRLKKDAKGKYLVDEVLHDFDPTEN